MSSAISFAMDELSRSPTLQEELRNELRGQNHDRGACNSQAEISSTPVLDAVCLETLRLYPPGPFTVRKANRQTIIGKQAVPAGTYVTIVPEAINKCQHFWGSNAREFNPDRWFKDGKNRREFISNGGAISQFSMQTFLCGPRVCPGRQLAMIEMKVFLSTLITHFKFSAISESRPRRVGLFSQEPADGVCIALTPVEPK